MTYIAPLLAFGLITLIIWWRRRHQKMEIEIAHVDRFHCEFDPPSLSARIDKYLTEDFERASCAILRAKRMSCEARTWHDSEIRRYYDMLVEINPTCYEVVAFIERVPFGLAVYSEAIELAVRSVYDCNDAEMLLYATRNSSRATRYRVTRLLMSLRGSVIRKSTVLWKS